VLSLVEVGFAANNYLILMDVVRGAGRAAVNLDPVFWDPAKRPTYDARSYERMDCDTIDKTFQLKSNTAAPGDPERSEANGVGPRGKKGPLALPAGLGYHLNVNDSSTYGFFDEVACQITKSMEPLIFNDNWDTGKEDPTQPIGRDDIIVSAISYATMSVNCAGCSFANAYNPDSETPVAGFALRGNSWVTVTGRWPKENRYCAYYSAADVLVEGDYRDPFDYKRPEFISGAGRGRDAADAGEGDPVGKDGLYDANPATNASYNLPNGHGSQGVRGYTFAGRAKPTDKCYGSTFTVQEIERRLNLPDGTWNKSAPNGGLVIIEVYWQHHPLFLGPIFQGFTGNPADDPVFHIWGMFPVPAVEATATPIP
ncbi:MAG: hypothetical protein IT324_29225, partial [Anaerolineae bacterium]|nr:hypothetical protein [Anaerolineae bacterium]